MTVPAKLAPRIRVSWEGFGALAKDARVKIILYPLLVVLGVVLSRVGDLLWNNYGPGPIHLTVQVKDKSGHGLEGASVIVEPIKCGDIMRDVADYEGFTSFKIDHRCKGYKVALYVRLKHYRPPSELPPFALDAEYLKKPVELQSETDTTETPTTGEQQLAAQVYRGPNGASWEKTHDGWSEHSLAHPETLLHFDELRRDSDYIYLVDRSRMKDNNPDDPLLLRLPAKGGVAQWSWSNPLVWIDLTIVTPQRGT